jgi:hypothetical protein
MWQTRPAAHFTGELVRGEWSRRIDGFQLMRMGQQVMVRCHSDQRAVDRRSSEMVSPHAFHHSPCPSSVLSDGNHVTGEVIKSCARSAGSGAETCASVSGRPFERGVLHSQQSGAPEDLSDPFGQPQQPDWQVGVGTPVAQDALRQCH